MSETEYILFCDESIRKGRYYSNFYGGVLVGASQYQRIAKRLDAKKLELNLKGEIQWKKVTKRYLDKYQVMVKDFFSEIRSGNLKVRIMFRQNAKSPTSLSAQQLEGTYFNLYYQFIKHAFGFRHKPRSDRPEYVRIYFDDFPQTREAATQFKGYILGLKDDPKIRDAGVEIRPEDITEVRSHDHVLLQCLDIVLGSMAFRLNDHHLEKPVGSKRRALRTVAKESLYKLILREIHAIYPGFNIGISTGKKTFEDWWEMPYRHWSFVPKEMEFRSDLTKRRKI